MATAPVKNPGFPGPPKFATVAEERRHRKERLAASFRLFSKFGFDEGVTGHITARDPEQPDHFWVNPFGVHFSQIRVSDLMLVNAKGEVVEGKHPLNGAAFAIHSSVHHARPDVIAAAHSHSLHGKAWSSLGRLLDPITQDACAFFEDHVVFDDFTGVVYDTSEGERIGARWGRAKRPSCATTGCSPSAKRWTKRCGGLSPWTAVARRSFWPKPRASPLPSIAKTRWLRAAKSARTEQAGFSSSRCGSASPANSPTYLISGE